MAEYIEREAALQALCEAVHAKDGNTPCRNQLVSCLWTGTRTQEYADKILAIPAADVVPVVRCRDCKHNQGVRTWIDHDLTADCMNGHGFPPLDWFCADGERKDGDRE